MLDKRRKLTRTVVNVYGREEIMEYKMAVLTRHVSEGRPIRVVVSRIIKTVKKNDGTEVEKMSPTGIFLSTNVEMTPEEIIESYSTRFSIEEMFKDLKEICELGKQQVRNFESNLACFQILTMNYAMVELLAWNQDEVYLKNTYPHGTILSVTPHTKTNGWQCK